MSDRQRRRRKRARDLKRRRGMAGPLAIESLEDKVLLDASGLMSPFSGDVAALISPSSEISLDTGEYQSGTADPENTKAATRTEIVFVDAGISQQDELVDGLLASRPGVMRHVINLASDANGMEQVANSLANFSDVDAVHIVSHGGDGKLHLGNSTVTGEQLVTEYEDLLRNIGSRLSSDADVLFYGCDLSKGEAGLDFVETFSKITGADVAASDDLTGHASLGGDWHLEVSIGKIETGIAFPAGVQETFTSTLQISGFSAAIGSDGTPSFDPNNNAGNDSGANNGIIRSHDIATFNVDFGTDSTGATNPTITSTLPSGMVWASLPAVAVGANSGIFDSVTGLPGGDMRTIVVHMPDVASAISTSIPIQARALGEQNGTMVNGIFFTMSADELPADLVSTSMDLVISSAPNMDIQVRAPHFRGIFNNPSTGKDGAVYTYGIGVLGDHPTRSGADAYKGAAPIESPFTFDVDLSGVSPNAELFTWGPTVGATLSDDGVRRNYERNAANTQTFWSLTYQPSGRTNEVANHSYWSEESSTPDSGDFTVTSPGGPGGTYGITVSGAGTAGPLPDYYAYGNSTSGNGPIPAQDAWFISGAMDVWIPLCDIEPGEDGVTGTSDDGVLGIMPMIGNFDPDDVWNDQSNFGPGTEDPANNFYKHDVVSSSIGGPGKHLFEYGRWRWVETGTYWRAGDNVTSVGHQYDVGVHSGRNYGVVPQPGMIWGDKFDNTSTKIVPISDYPAGSGVNRSNHTWSRVYQVGGSGSKWLQEGSDYIIEFGTGGAGGNPAGWTDWNTMGDASLADSETSTVWTTDPTDIAALGGTADSVTGVSDAVTKWRVKLLIDLEPGAYVYGFVSHETVGHSTLDLAADPTGDIIGNTISASSELRRSDDDPTNDWINSEYNPLDNRWFPEGTSSDIYRGDRLRIVDAQVRVDKSVVDVGTGGNFIGGSTATFEIAGTVTIPGPDSGVPAQDVYVTDILPGGLTVTPGGVSPTSTNGNPVEYCIVCDGSDWTPYYPTMGLAVGVRWFYGDVPLNTALPTMSIEVLVPYDAPSGTQFENIAVIESPSDPSPEDDRDSSAGLTAIQLAALGVNKIALTPLVPLDTLMVFEVGVANLSDDRVIPYVDTIDILPWSGDEDGSMFSGNFTNVDVTNIDPGLTFTSVQWLPQR